MIFLGLPPSLPIAIGTSPKGEGARMKVYHFPLGGNRKGGEKKFKIIGYY